MRASPPTDLKPYFLVLDDIVQEYEGKLDWPKFFGSDRPVEIDVGCGRGLFLYHAAEAHPERNFLGIELDYKEGRRGARRLQKKQFDNARVLGGDVFVAFTKMIAPHSVDAIHVYFPDPWWKRKHRRRRVFNDTFVDLCAGLIKPGGWLHSWTDVEEYFGVISGLMDHHALFEKGPPLVERAPSDDMDYQTSYERKKRKLGLPIYRGRWQRRPLTAEIQS
ncbi:tRNA (guanosine(46)-N7)-methyltransferase TrmB [Planctomicrobium sp. SH664]|uniref:tRNA (guanosine(46)-N7)-methyltransferase TrmB n=1 Tax=Planctomicrobium sp. SH664 TaxID=3448125 RepID=UPI003F5BCF73